MIWRCISRISVTSLLLSAQLIPPWGLILSLSWSRLWVILRKNGGNPTLRHADTSGVGSHSQWCVQLTAASRVRGYPQSGSAFRDRNGRMGQGLLSIGKKGQETKIVTETRRQKRRDFCPYARETKTGIHFITNESGLDESSHATHERLSVGPGRLTCHPALTISWIKYKFIYVYTINRL